MPDDIPRDLLDKARCIVVVPSVLKAAFIVGADYGRGTMVCRTGKDFSGLWGAPAMYALEGGSVGFQIGGEATDFGFPIYERSGSEQLAAQESSTWGRCFHSSRTRGPGCGRGHGCLFALGDSE